jgi:Lrp/AsnC family transcriptional regulator for asnA, asnC and gidA
MHLDGRIADASSIRSVASRRARTPGTVAPVATDDHTGDTRLDDTDHAILRELQEDGRRPYREIARNVGVSERTIRARVRAMHDAGVLRIVAFVDPAKVGHSVLALVFLRVTIDAHDKLVEELASWNEVSYVSSLMGHMDICLQVICRDNDGLWDLVNHRLRGLEGVLETETMLEMRVHKFRYASEGLAE